ncbi:hypothetical protein FE257_007098 [Aspergillus nanangensis]|uniref:Uncharacterized protein n=1 Tax=Aspergillus nanangensis TaxID=2582783 RepID=A0AAD4CN59_ASPNN|nr:hypothetical protein FE257_007098 [Aspergillus nanangensis]
MQDCISWNPHIFFNRINQPIECWEVRRDQDLRKKFLKQLLRDPLPFKGDFEIPDALSPPLAWTLIWGGTYSNVLPDDIPKALRLWGYVLWDAVRLEKAGAKEVLMQQCKEQWNDFDPRDYDYYIENMYDDDEWMEALLTMIPDYWLT